MGLLWRLKETVDVEFCTVSTLLAAGLSRVIIVSSHTVCSPGMATSRGACLLSMEAKWGSGLFSHRSPS